MNAKRAKEDVFGTQKKLHLGPGDYEPSVNFTKNQSLQLKFMPNMSHEVLEVESMQQEFKKIRLFDGSASSIKPLNKSINCATLEERRVVDLFADAAKGSKAEAVFNSRQDRFAQNSYLNYVKNPGP